MAEPETYAGYVCWERQSARTIIDIEAVSRSDAVFLATHWPARIRRVDAVTRRDRADALVDESSVLDDFLAPSDLTLRPIIGDSGSGKSHLIRWLQAHIDPHDPKLAVVKVPKARLGLRGVIELVLEHMAGPAVDRIRADLREAASSLDPGEAPDRLLFELGRAIDSERALRNPDGTPNQYRAALTKDLPPLLRDEVYRTKLLEPGGVIQRLVAQALGTHKDDDQPGMVAQDLPVDVIGMNRAHPSVKSAFARLARPEMRETAVQMLNEQLDHAVGMLVGMGKGSLFEALLDVRAELLEADKELILLIEDFAMMHGVQDEFLDAVIEPAREHGLMIRAPVRVAFAITPGPYADLPETVKTRAQTAYDLDVGYESDDNAVSHEEVERLTAVYLNAARLGPDDLAAAYDARSDDDWVPNACTPCPFRTTCHAAFGERDGYGLYPFNAASVDRVARARLKPSAETAGDRFVPRQFLGGIEDTLDHHHDEIPQAKFPSVSWGEKFRSRELPPLDESVVEQFHAGGRDADEDRRRVLLTAWAVRGGVPARAVNLHPGIHEAFNLPRLPSAPPIDDAETETEGPGGGNGRTTDDTDTKQEKKRPDPLQQRIDALNRWRDGEALPGNYARELRRAIADAVIERVEWTLEFAQRSLASEYFSERKIWIHNAQVGSRGKPDPDAIELDAKTDVAVMQAFMQYEHHGDWSFKGGAERFRLYSSKVEEWATTLLARILAATAAQGPAYAEALLTGALILGSENARARRDKAKLVAAIFELPGEAGPRSAEWTRLVELVSAERERQRAALCGRAGVFQSDRRGAPLAIDVGPLIEGIEAVKKRDWHAPGPDSPLPDDLRQFWERLEPILEAAIAAEERALQEWSDAVSAHALDGTRTSELVGSLEDALAQAVVQGFITERGAGLTQQLDSAKDMPLGIITSSRNTIAAARAAQTRRERLEALASGGAIERQRVKEFVDLVDEIVTNATSRAEGRLRELGADPDSVDAARRRVRSAIEDLTQVLEAEA